MKNNVETDQALNHSDFRPNILYFKMTSLESLVIIIFFIGIKQIGSYISPPCVLLFVACDLLII